MFDKLNKVLAIVAIIPFSLCMIIGLYTLLGLGNKKSTQDTVKDITNSTLSSEEPTLLVDSTPAVDKELKDNSEGDLQSNSTPENVIDKEELQKQIKDDENLVFMGNVRNDVTGNWRLSEYASSDQFQNFALDYYKAFFEDDKEVHAVINMSTKVTASISKIGDTLYISLYEYVDGEEHDAKELFTGMFYKEYWINTITGEIEEIR